MKKLSSKIDIEKENPFERKSCYDCSYLRPKVTWWCENKEAIKARGHKLPGVIHCPFWEPDYNYIDEKFIPESLKENIIESKTSLLHKIYNNLTTFFKK